MKLRLLVLTLIVVIPNLLNAQSADKKLAVGVYNGISDYRGDLNQEWFNKGAWRTQVGATLMYYTSAWFNTGIDVGFGQHGFHIANSSGFRANVFKANVQSRLKLNNGVILREESRIQPYFFGGLGLALVQEDSEAPSSNVPGADFTGNLGFGFNVMLNKYVGLNYNLNYAYTNHDKRDNVSNGKNDQFMIHSVGIVIPIGKMIDTDGDGVSDRRDKSPNTPTGIAVDNFGCPNDADGDGIADYQDDCPDQVGLPSMKGCPDRDDDGITDALDKCPDEKGDASAFGCPDRDHDSIPDSQDACPDVKGLASLQGCPDTDGDGIPDAEDKCPTEKGSLSMQGCPDTDGDGIIDSNDKCPLVFGVAANDGCPEIKEETKKVFEQALKGIQFETAKAVIKKSSFPILNNVAKIMLENPTYNLDINGHTDAQGDDAKNLLLSTERAASVKTYLINQGVDAKRMESYGYGEMQPKATNDTPEGRAENRRVEFIIRF